jgi:hydrogenase maturation protein HypF
MVPDLETAARIARISPAARAALVSAARPIVLLPRLPSADLAPSVAPKLSELGIMLPTTALHLMLLALSSPILVMTSANVAEEPIVKDEDEAFRALASIADAFLVHDRAIHTRADDSVVRVVAGDVQPVRRGRGFVPDSLPLDLAAPALLAVGADLKNAICVAHEREAVLSQHVGDLISLDARAFFEEVIAKVTRLRGVRPTVVAHDLHPEYASTRWALDSGLRTIAVQHHHAHVTSCLAEHRREGPAIGVAFDGTGCGPAGEAWGGEILVFDYLGFGRAGHLRPIALAGGEAAIREPWRLAVAALADAGVPLQDDTRSRRLQRLLTHPRATARATGAGRWFDAVAAILGVREHITYEAQAAIELESLASTSTNERPYRFRLDGTETAAPFVVDLRPTILDLVRDLRDRVALPTIASRFYTTMAEVVRASCAATRRRYGIGLVALSGGCFQSVLLTERAKAALEAEGFEVLVHRRVPPNDGGLAFGQAVIASHLVAKEG